MLDEQRDALMESPHRRPAQLLGQHPCRRRVLAGQTFQPRTALLLPQAVFEEQGQVIVVVLEVPVVEHLRVVRIGAGVEQQPRERIALRMGRLIRPILAPSERAREGGKGVRTGPEKARIGIGAARQQQSRHFHRRMPGIDGVEARIAGVEERLPAERPALFAHERRIAIDERADRVHLTRR